MARIYRNNYIISELFRGRAIPQFDFNATNALKCPLNLPLSTFAKLIMILPPF